MKIIHVVGARPNFMKAAPVYTACTKYEINQLLVHTGQHYDKNMSDVFFQQLGLPQPDLNLEVGSASHAEQTATVMIRFEKVLLEHRPDWVMVYGDINSTVAAALTSAKLLIPVAHVEAGLRSFDRRMPEEINRLLTDQIASLLFTPSQDGNENLRREGIACDKIKLVGNVMIDTLIKFLPLTQEVSLANYPNNYILVTLHRPSNVDDETTLQQIITTLKSISQRIPLIFPIHPRTRQRLVNMSINLEDAPQLHLTEPLSYLEFLALEQKARAVITDSGGIQEETTYLGVPCFTLRENTERPITLEIGSNKLIGFNYPRLEHEIEIILTGQAKAFSVPPLWDGHAAERIAEIMVKQA